MPEQATIVTTTAGSEGSRRSGGAYALFLGTKTFASLDGLRAIAILVVLWHHTYDGTARWPLVHRGFLGVDLFFVISGFLIVTLLRRERRRTGDISLRGFYVRRFLRIFPPYYLVLALVGGVAFLLPGNTSAAIRRDLPYSAFYVSNLVPMLSMLAITWSLSTEEQFYVVVPTLEKYLPRTFPMLLPAAYVLLSLPPFGLLSGIPWPGFFLQTTFGPILLGVMLAHILDDPRGYRLLHRLLGHWASPLIALALVLLVTSYPGDDISGWPRIAIHATMFVLVASCVIREDQALRPVLTLWPMRRIGVVSYGIYLYHMMVRHGVAKGMAVADLSSQWVFFVGTTLATWLVAEMSFRLFEQRFLALKGALAPERPRPGTAGPARQPSESPATPAS